METEISELLAAPGSPEVGRALLEWARSTGNRVVRGDMAIGILPLEQVRLVPTALRRAAELGVREAWIELAKWEAQPPFGERNPRQADGTLRHAVALGVQGAPLQLARLRWFLRRADCSEEEQREAMQFARDSVAAEPLNSAALYLLALLLCAGFGAPSDPPRAAATLQASAELGSVDALFELYAYHASGIGVAKDEAKAFSFNQRAAEAGHPRAMYNMGAFCATGRYLPKDIAAAVKWYSQAAEAGNPLATKTLAVMYASGAGVEQDRERAAELFNEAEYLGLEVSELRESFGV